MGLEFLGTRWGLVWAVAREGIVAAVEVHC